MILFPADESSVVLRDGTTSVSPLLKEYSWSFEMLDNNQLTTEKPFQSFVTTLSSGFYVAFKGVFSPDARFAIVYTAFSYMGKVENLLKFFLNSFPPYKFITIRSN